MRVRFFITEQASRSDIGGQFMHALQEALKAFDDIQVLGKESSGGTPDLVHVAGAFDIHAAKTLFQAHKLLLPVVYSPLGGLQEWEIKERQLQKRTLLVAYQRRMLRLADAVHVLSPVERQSVEAIATPRRTQVIMNPIVTSQISIDGMGQAFRQLYQDVAAQHEDDIRSGIDKRTAFLDDKPAMQAIIRQMLYIRYRLHQGSLPKPLLDSLAKTMTESDYDEDDMAGVLEQMGLYPLMARLEQVMATTSGLTEGFMPIPPASGKDAARIREHVE